MRHSTIEQELAEHGKCLIQTVGVSMEPLLHNRFSTVVLEKVQETLCRNDVVLFRRPGDDYVLHRVIRVRENDYVIRGDNCLYDEVVYPEQIIGVMTGFWSGDEFVDCAASEDYKRYVNNLKYRYPLRRCRALPGRAARKLKRAFLRKNDRKKR